ncbi:hypothetical protein Tco_0949168, partial [Tanacetum coccineum]
DDLVMLWSLVKEKFNSTEPTDDKEREIWVELERLFELDIDDELWKLWTRIVNIGFLCNVWWYKYPSKASMESSWWIEIMRCPENFLERYSCRLKDQEDKVFGRILSENKDSNPILELYATPVEKQTGWFIASIQFINGLIDEDLNVSQDDAMGVVSGNCVDLQHNSVSAVSVFLANSHEGLNETRVGNNDMLFTGRGRRFLDSKGGAKNPESNKDKQPTLADVLDEVCALRKEVTLVKFDDARITKLERLLNDKFMFRNDSPNVNHNAVNQGLSGSANHPMVDGKNDSQNVDRNAVNKGLSGSANDHMSTCSSPDMDNGKVAIANMGIQKADAQNDIPNANHNVVNQVICGSANDPMADGQNDIPNDNHNVVNQVICGLANDPMLDILIQVACDGMRIDKADGNNDYTYSQRKPSIFDVLVQGFDSQKNHPGINVLQHVTHVDCSIAKVNDHPTADIGVKAIPVDEFADDFMDVLNNEESILNYSLDDMKLQDEEEKLISTLAPINHQRVDELIDVHVDKTIVLQENVMKSSFFTYFYSYVSVKERKKRLAMSLDSPFGQQATPTLAPPKIISKSVNGDFIVPPEFLEDVSGEPKMRSINELMTLEVFVELIETSGWVCGNRRPWWQNMKRTMPQQLTLYLNEHVVLQSKGIAVETYEIKYIFPKVVRQADDYGDCGVWLSIDGGSITSAPTIMTMPSNHFLKLLGFNNHDLPIVEVATSHIMAHTIQVYMENSQSFKNVDIRGNFGFWSGGLMSYVDLVKVFRHDL